MTRLEVAVNQIRFARGYTSRLLDSIPQADWFRMPGEGVTHVAWQVGHLAFAQYRMALDRLRGVRPEDEELIPTAFLTLFGRDSVPDADPAKYPDTVAIRAVFDRVHQRAMEEAPRLPESEWDQPLVKPHSLAKTKMDCLFWCGQHELVHAGQIALLRRLLGQKPLW